MSILSEIGTYVGAKIKAVKDRVTSIEALVNGTTGLVDGRDVSADGTKLDGIEAGATADQTKADIDALNIAAATATTADSAIRVQTELQSAGSHYLAFREYSATGGSKIGWSWDTGFNVDESALYAPMIQASQELRLGTIVESASIKYNTTDNSIDFIVN